MNFILRNGLRLLLVLLWPMILLLSGWLLMRKKRYAFAVKHKLTDIIINTLLFTIVGIAVIWLFFHMENTIYSYDYSGHWLRSLYIKKWFFENPASILGQVYNSMNHQEYSYLPALLMLGVTLISPSYGWFCVSIFLNFVVPTFILLQVFYFSFNMENPRLPLLISAVFYPLWFILFNGEVDIGNLFFLMMMILLTLHQEWKHIDWIDTFSVNLFALLLIFFRRYSLYMLVVFYPAYLLKYVFASRYMKEKKLLRNLLLLFSSGAIALLVLLLFFRPYIGMILGNNFSEAYEAYDRTGKISEFISYFSLLIISFVVYGVYRLVKEKEIETLFDLFLMTVVPLLLFWRVQSLEHHHYTIITLPLLYAFAYGMINMWKQRKKALPFVLSAFLCLNAMLVLSPMPQIPLISTPRRSPEKMADIDKIRELSTTLYYLTEGEGISAYMASGSLDFNDDILRNAALPDLSQIPQIDSAVLDLRDGFPRDLQFIKYIITIDPIQYFNKPYQHIYDIISNALWTEPLIQEIYQLVYTTEIDDMKIEIYERTGDFSPAVKEYFYNEIIQIYPDKAEEFRYILD